MASIYHIGTQEPLNANTINLTKDAWIITDSDIYNDKKSVIVPKIVRIHYAPETFEM